MTETVESGAESTASVAAMADYYARRAAEYERVYHKPERQADLRAMEAWLTALMKGRHVLELACGTGWWTLHGAREACRWLATDLNAQTLQIARAKPMPQAVTFAEADAYALEGVPVEPYDAAFTGCWWSHVPLTRLAHWLQQLHCRLQPGALVVMLDNAYVAGSSTPISRRDAEGNTYQQRRLDDGSTHEVLKNFPRFEDVAHLLPTALELRWHDFHHYWAVTYRLP